MSRYLSPVYCSRSCLPADVATRRRCRAYADIRLMLALCAFIFCRHVMPLSDWCAYSAIDAIIVDAAFTMPMRFWRHACLSAPCCLLLMFMPERLSDYMRVSRAALFAAECRADNAPAYLSRSFALSLMLLMLFARVVRWWFALLRYIFELRARWYRATFSRVYADMRLSARAATRGAAVVAACLPLHAWWAQAPCARYALYDARTRMMSGAGAIRFMAAAWGACCACPLLPYACRWYAAVYAPFAPCFTMPILLFAIFRYSADLIRCCLRWCHADAAARSDICLPRLFHTPVTLRWRLAAAILPLCHDTMLPLFFAAVTFMLPLHVCPCAVCHFALMACPARAHARRVMRDITRVPHDACYRC